MKTGPTTSVRLLPALEWVARAEAHKRRVDDLTAAHRERVQAQRTHPVEDFLFTYYSLRPRQLRRWHPGVGHALAGPQAAERLSWRWHREVEAVDGSGGLVAAVGLDCAAYLADRGDLVRFVTDLLTAVHGRPAQLGCFGLHEWAMSIGVRRATFAMTGGRCGSARTEPTAWSSATRSAALTTTRTASSRLRPWGATRSGRPADRSSRSTSRVACTRRWTC